MSVVHLYEVFVADADARHAVEIVSLPFGDVRSETDEHAIPSELADPFNYEGYQVIIASPDAITKALCLLLNPDEAGALINDAAPGTDTSRLLDDVWTSADDGVKDFARYLAEAPIVPFTGTLPSFKSLIELAQQPSSVIAVVVSFVAFGPTPVLIIAIPAGRILFHAADRVDDAVVDPIFDGLKARLRKWAHVQA